MDVVRVYHDTTTPLVYYVCDYYEASQKRNGPSNGTILGISPSHLIRTVLEIFAARIVQVRTVPGTYLSAHRKVVSMYAISAYILICLHTCWGMCSGTVTPLSKLVIEEFTLESKTALRSITLSTSPTNTHTSFLNNGNNPKVEWEHAKKTHFTQMKVVSALKNTFLPIGYPISVPPEYSTFQVWNILQGCHIHSFTYLSLMDLYIDFCSYLRGIMGTKAILEGLGVGRADATSLSATLAWIVRDGVSMLGSLLFTSLSSSTFGQNVKSWRYFADTINKYDLSHVHCIKWLIFFLASESP